MKKKSYFKRKSLLDKAIENNGNEKRAWKKIILELEKVKSNHKEVKDD